MDIREYLAIWRSRWISIVATLVIAVGGAALISAFTTPQYEGSSQLFVTTTGGASVAEAYQGNLFSTERVTSYASLAAGKQVAQRTVDSLEIDMSASELVEKVTATPQPESVLLDISVLDPDPELARDLANTIAAQTSQLVSELETSARGGSPAASATLVELADTPSSPVSPQWVRNLALGAVAGLLLGLVVSVLQARLDTSVKDAENLTDQAGAPTVGVIPREKITKDTDPLLFVPERPAASEAFRELRTNMSFVGATKEARVLVFTSPKAATGTTTVVASLGITLGEIGHSVIVVDGDLRAPSLAAHLGMTDDVGTSSVLAGHTPLDGAVQESSHPGLSVLASGPIPPNPSELLSTEILVDTVKELRATYDFVLIDTSPVLQFSDAALLAKSADGVLLLARYGGTKLNDTAKAAEKLRLVGANVLGSVLTAARMKSSS